MHATTTRAHLALACVLAWRQHSKPRPHHRLPLSSPSGTLGMGMVDQSTRRAVASTTLTVLPSSVTKQGPPPLQTTPTGIILSRGISVMWQTRKSERWRGSDGSSTHWRSMRTFKQSCAPPLTHRPTLSTSSSATLASILMLKSHKDLSLGKESGCSSMSGCSSHSISHFSVISSLVLLSTSSSPWSSILAIILFSNLKKMFRVSNKKPLAGHGSFFHAPIAMRSISNTHAWSLHEEKEKSSKSLIRGKGCNLYRGENHFNFKSFVWVHFLFLPSFQF
jgi:hypothetical protein